MVGIHTLVFIALFAASGATHEPQDQNRFAPVAQLAGACWEGTFTDGTRDRHCWSWALGGAYLRDSHELQGSKQPYGGETFYGWDAEASMLRFWYFNSAGGRSEGTVTRVSGEQRWLLTEDYSGATPSDETEQKVDLRNFLVVEQDAYRVVTQQRDGAEWTPVMNIRFERVR